MSGLWDIPFGSSMVGQNIAVFCPTQEQAFGLMDVLGKFGIHWAGDSQEVANRSNAKWARHREETCYVIDELGLRYGTQRMVDGMEKFNNYIKCTFEPQMPEFEVAEDSAFLALIGVK